MARRRELTDDFFARKVVEARARLEMMTPTPRPRESPQLQVADARRVGCVRYGACLDLAFAARWEGFSCEGCPAFALPTQEEFMADLEGLTLLLAAVINKHRSSFDEVQVWTFE